MQLNRTQDKSALLLYRVGPVLVCSPSMLVASVIAPPNLTVTPGSNNALPGVFKTLHGVARLVDLRVRFGTQVVEKSALSRVIIVEIKTRNIGFLVDDVEDIVDFPDSGWSQIPPYMPTDIFTRTLVEHGNIRLYAEFEQLDNIKVNNYLVSYIKNIKQAENIESPLAEKTGALSRKSQSQVINSSKHEDKIAADLQKKSTLNTAIYESNEIKKQKKEILLKAQTESKKIKNNQPTLKRKAIKSSKHSVTTTLLNENNGKNKSLNEGVKKYNSAALAVLPEINIAVKQPLEFKSDFNGNNVLAESKHDSFFKFIIYAVLGILLSLSVYYFIQPIIIDVSQVAKEKKINSHLNVKNKITLSDHKKDSYLAKIDRFKDAYNSYELGKVELSKNKRGITIIVNEVEGSSGFNKKQGGLESVIEIEESSNDVQNTQHQDKKYNEPMFEAVDRHQAIRQASKRYVHRVIKGDTLWHIAKRYINNPWRYPELARLSNIDNPDLIYPGDKVIIVINYK